MAFFARGELTPIKGAVYIDAGLSGNRDLEDVFIKLKLDKDGEGVTFEVKKEDSEYLKDFDLQMVFRKLSGLIENDVTFTKNKYGSENDHEDVLLKRDRALAKVEIIMPAFVQNRIMGLAAAA